MLEETRGRRAIRDDDGDRTVSVLSPLLVRPANICFNLRPAVRPSTPTRTRPVTLLFPPYSYYATGIIGLSSSYLF